MYMRSRPFFLPALLAVAVASCDILNPKEVDYRKQALEETARRETLWKSLAIHDYDFDFVRTCACDEAARQQVTIHVRSDNIARVSTNSGVDVVPQAGISWPTVDSLYLWTRQLLNDRAFAVEVAFDTTHHFPERITGEDPGRSVIVHMSSNFVERAAGTPAVRAAYRSDTPLSKSKSVTWRSR
jgi:hypothetical protein